MIASLDYKSIEFHVSKKRYSNIETKNNNNVNVLVYYIKKSYPTC